MYTIYQLPTGVILNKKYAFCIVKKNPNMGFNLISLISLYIFFIHAFVFLDILLERLKTQIINKHQKKNI